MNKRTTIILWLIISIFIWWSIFAYKRYQQIQNNKIIQSEEIHLLWLKPSSIEDLNKVDIIDISWWDFIIKNSSWEIKEIRPINNWISKVLEVWDEFWSEEEAKEKIKRFIESSISFANKLSNEDININKDWCDMLYNFTINWSNSEGIVSTNKWKITELWFYPEGKTWLGWSYTSDIETSNLKWNRIIDEDIMKDAIYKNTDRFRDIKRQNILFSGPQEKKWCFIYNSNFITLEDEEKIKRTITVNVKDLRIKSIEKFGTSIY